MMIFLNLYLVMGTCFCSVNIAVIYIHLSSDLVPRKSPMEVFLSVWKQSCSNSYRVTVYSAPFGRMGLVAVAATIRHSSRTSGLRHRPRAHARAGNDWGVCKRETVEHSTQSA